MALKLGIQALGSYLKLTCKYVLYILSSTKVSAAKDHGENSTKVRPPLVRHLQRNRLLSFYRYIFYRTPCSIQKNDYVECFALGQ